MLTPELLNALKRKTHQYRLFGAHGASLAYFASELFKKQKKATVIVARNHAHLEELKNELNYFLPDGDVCIFPAWDVQPYDRLNPDSVIKAERLQTLAQLAENKRRLIITTTNALSIKVPPLESLPASLDLHVGGLAQRDTVIQTLEKCGYMRVGTVMEPLEYAVRGSLIDVYVGTEENPFRIDFFDDEIESIKTFDAATQRSLEERAEVAIKSVSDFVLDEARVSQFRKGYRSLFPKGAEDPLYRDISEGKSHEMMDHFVPLFFEEEMVSLFDVLEQESLFIHHGLMEDAFAARLSEVEDAYQTRVEMMEEDEGEMVYRPLSPSLLYLTEDEWQKAHLYGKWLKVEDFDDGSDELIHLPCENVSFDGPKGKNTLDMVVERLKAVKNAQGRILVSAFSPSSLATVCKTLKDHDLEDVSSVSNFKALKKGVVSVGVTALNWGFHDQSENLLVLTEQDIFGEKQNAPRKRKKNAADLITHFSEMEKGDYVVHSDHGIGQFIGLVSMDVSGDGVQDFIELNYDGGDKLFVPVVNLDVLSKYSGDNVRLDKLGSAAWQSRKAKVKRQLLDMAGELIEIAAKRQTRKGHVYKKPDGMYDEFCAEFPYIPTSEQQAAVEDVEADLYSPYAMDRLVVGDVGFGKTEVALRAAFVAAADSKQVALIVPTTLLARQHFDNFSKRFKKFPFKVAVLSRLITAKQKKETLEALERGEIDIVIGTHALLSDSIRFRDLGLLIIDEEQRFGVAHKEKLKKMKAEVDVLTLTATPIPRTFQMAMSGLKGMSLITTPPVDRLAVRSYVMRMDKKVIREAILREIFRGGQVFVVTPRVEGLSKLLEMIHSLVPEAKARMAHGQMPKDALDRTMTDFYEGKFNVLVATTIVESGIDVPKANTLIVHKAHQFGLAQLYQIRGRVGRSKVRAYAYFLLPHGGMSENAVKRLRILQRLEGVGAGFTLASYDMDIRGSGNILGKEQSGHIKEVGFELYNKMLQEAVDAYKSGKKGEDALEEVGFSVTLNLGLSFFIPELYVPDESMRMSLYRRISALKEPEDVEDFRAEMIDRFGELPHQVSALLDVVVIKNRAKNLGLEKIDVGAKGATLTFFKNRFKNAEKMIEFIMKNTGVYKIRPDQKIVVMRPIGTGLSRLKSVQIILEELENISA